MRKDFQSKVALVTGGGSGIGAAVARMLAERDSKVMVVDLRRDAAALVAGEIGENARAHTADVTNPEQCKLMVEATLEAFGRLDAAINCAGISPTSTEPVSARPLDQWKRVIEANLDGVFYSMRSEIPALLRTKGGAIVNVASIGGVVGVGGVSDYIASKHGVVGLTRSAALEYAAQGLRINCVCPGVIDTPILKQNAIGANRKALESMHPIGRLGRAEEVAELIAFLASDAASFCVGGCYPVDGGWTAQ